MMCRYTRKHLPSSEVLELVLELNALRNSDTVLGDLRAGCIKFSSISAKLQSSTLLTLGPPNACSIITLRPLGPRVTETAFARVSTPASRAVRPAFPNKISCERARCTEERWRKVSRRPDSLVRPREGPAGKTHLVSGANGTSVQAGGEPGSLTKGGGAGQHG